MTEQEVGKGCMKKLEKYLADGMLLLAIELKGDMSRL